MILTYGNTSSFGDLHWYMVELRSEKTIESTLRRLGQELRKIFAESAVEIFVPIKVRDLHRMELSTGNYIFARSPNFQALLAMKPLVTGVVGLVTEGDSRHPSKVLKADHSYVKGLIEEAELEFLERASTIDVGSFVRILDGEMRDWCGTVTEIHDGIAAVKVEIKTKIMLIETPVRNLIDKSHVPDCLRVFYFGDLVESLLETGEEQLVAEDLHYVPDPLLSDDGLEAAQPTRHGRQQTVTALVKRLIVTGTLDPKTIGKHVLEALKDGVLKRPKSLSIVHGIIKSRMIEDHFLAHDPTIENYRQVVERFGQEYKFSLQDLISLDPGTGIPVNSEGEKVQDTEAS